jgi:hypothetical protein
LGDEDEDWKSKKTAAAVRILEKIKYFPIIKAISKVEESGRWDLGLRFTEMMAAQIFKAAGRAVKRVDGSSMDQWCPDTARNVEELWKMLVKTQKEFERQFLIKSFKNYILRSSSIFLANSIKHMMDYRGLQMRCQICLKLTQTKSDNGKSLRMTSHSNNFQDG